MRNICKKQEPNSLTRYRCQPDADYDRYREKDALCAALVEEQRGLCCYCMSRIKIETATIEHWYPQARYRRDKNNGGDIANHGDLDYRNLLAVCQGNAGRPPKDQHCGSRKGDRLLKFNPAIDNVESQIHFLGNGTIFAPDDDEFNTQLNEVLNLNHARLKNQRAEVLNGFKQAITKQRSSGREFSRKFLGRTLNAYTSSSRATLEPFCQVVVFWIRKRLQRS